MTLLTKAELGADVFVYRNLHKRCWSVVNRTGRRLLLGHAGSLALGGAWFSLGAKGRDRVRREKRKNVHAGACGKLVGLGGVEFPPDLDAERALVTYNPMMDDFFTWPNGEPLPRKGETDSLVVVMNKGRCYAFEARAA